MLTEGKKRLWGMRADPTWNDTRALPSSHKQERSRAKARLRQQHRFSEYDLHTFAYKGFAHHWNKKVEEESSLKEPCTPQWIPYRGSVAASVALPCGW